jgi:hypothetical protein
MSRQQATRAKDEDEQQDVERRSLNEQPEEDRVNRSGPETRGDLRPKGRSCCSREQ